MGAVAGIVSAASGGAQMGLGFAQGQANAQAASLRGRFESDVAERNAKIAEKQGADAVNLGALEENRLRGETAQEVSSGRAAAGASGVDVNIGSAAGTAASQNLIGNVDALTIRNNAARQAWGFDVEAANERMQGRLALLAGENQAAGDRTSSVTTLLTQGASVFGGMYRNRNSGGGGTTVPAGRRVTDTGMRNG